jgi:DNA-binding FrmR family transcriptional regulator
MGRELAAASAAVDEMKLRRLSDMVMLEDTVGCFGSFISIYTPAGYFNGIRGMNDKATAKINRLNRIAGQVRGVANMVEEDRYCIDILNQIQAVKSALSRVETQVLKDHAACCVAEAIASGDADEQREKFEELVELFEKRR